jgi:uncharacterized protein YukE
MKAVLGLAIIYVAMFFLAIQGASQNSLSSATRTAAGQAGHSVDPAKETDIRSLMELVGARDAVQDVAVHGTDQLHEDLLPSVPADNADEATAQLVTIYDQHFTQDEIKGLLQFYGSPLGQKFAAEMPRINAEMQAANRALSARTAKAALKDTRKQYRATAAHARVAKPRLNQTQQALEDTETQP